MYLFNNTPIQTRFDESDKKIASELNKITDNELLNCDLQKIADRIEQQYSIICDTEFTTEDVEPISYLMPISREALRPELRIGAIHEFYDFVAVDYKFKIQGDYTFFFNTPTDTHYAPIKGSANANGLTLTIITEYTRIPLSDEWKERVKEDIKFLVSSIKKHRNSLPAVTPLFDGVFGVVRSYYGCRRMEVVQLRRKAASEDLRAGQRQKPDAGPVAGPLAEPPRRSPRACQTVSRTVLHARPG